MLAGDCEVAATAVRNEWMNGRSIYKGVRKRYRYPEIESNLV